ncbi:MAG: hypothetical protein GYB52_06995 [Rhodospirillales bacterium]|nr:hypothetical protein [Rhodospirillales bacterium]MBR9816360.1 hypothetical protein [Rhodospirillales bacterium]
MDKSEQNVTVICHRVHSMGQEPCIGYTELDAHTFPNDTPIGEIVEWATGDNKLATSDDIRKMLVQLGGYTRRSGLFRIEIVIPPVPQPQKTDLTEPDASGHRPDENFPF